ncbi:ScbA/BarX family gamma-butyrolactone biosynthesis protein [Streptomyces sp. NBC_00503]|uniref:ScbA/BarX family gamma-butyrolactone biosynthesis protein n=1 Tax=Streptomyces sp. NBC_00503 TaxID=2903659 RepID=UPI002E81FBF4|nr:ScbA/BarX family gamma-butyrolactone biosynthesis protein [Streptomyces sp. NBC_00503]WUD86493.1 transcriptional regulator [Streptomyces sp. NBC_00503]
MRATTDSRNLDSGLGQAGHDLSDRSLFEAHPELAGSLLPETGYHRPGTTVPRQYVHRAALAEVFLTGIGPAGADSYLVTAQWPRGHSLYGSRDGRLDPMLACETVRQTVPLLSHTVFDVPFGHMQSWDRIAVGLDPDAMRAGATPPEIEMRVRCHDTVLRGSRLVSTSLAILLFRDGDLLGSAQARYSCHTPAVYKRLRAGRADVHPDLLTKDMPQLPPAVPAAVGRDRASDVVLSPTGRPGQWLLRVDPSHPILFDHPVDHAPGMLLLEAARQAAHAACGGGDDVVLSLESEFIRYVELDAPCRIEARRLSADPFGRSQVLITGTQSGATAFTVAVTMQPRAEVAGRAAHAAA